MPLQELSASFVSCAVCPQGQAKIDWYDTAITGFILSVRSSGMTFSLRYRDPHGKLRQHRIGDAKSISFEMARQAAQKLRASVVLGEDPSEERKTKRSSPLLTAFFHETYLPWARVHKRSYKRDIQLYARIGKAFGNLRLNQIQKQKVAVWHAGLMEGGLSAASADHHPKLLRRMFSMAIEYELLEKNPLANFTLFNHDNKVENYLSDEQLVSLMDVLRTDSNRTVCNIAILLLGTGCRLNELLSCKKSDISIENRVLKIAASNSKSKRIRTVPLNDASIDIVLQQMEDTKGYDFLFINHMTKKPYTTIMKVWTRLRNKAGLPHLRIHDLRHSFASFLVNSGRTLYEVQQILGHSQSIVTERYAHLSTKTLQDASNSASVIIRGAMQAQVKTVVVSALVPPALLEAA